jgi:DNA-directed RNA polymerase subunit M/transcription elongation factor TFIIS
MAKGIKIKPNYKLGGIYKICPICKEDKPLMMFARDNSKSDGVTYHCKECRNTYRKTPHAAELHRNQAREYYRHIVSDEKKKCIIVLHKLFNWGLKKGPCEVCSATEDIQAHHPDYTDPLNIVWLCKRCHAYLHRIKGD